jgi:hypothetical protein
MENASNFGQKIITDKIIVSSSDDLNLSMANLKRKIDLATGQKKVDLLVKNASIINVFSGEIHEDNVAIADGIFVGFGHTEEYKNMMPGILSMLREGLCAQGLSMDIFI